MNAARLDSDENIACLLCVGLKYLVLINNADRETCEVVLLLGHKTGVLGSFTAYERAACLNAAVSHARNDLCYLFGDILSAGNIICCGAKPQFFLDYIACGKNVPERIAEIVSGIAEGCVQSGAALVGGETAEMPGFYPVDEYDLAGFSVGVVDKAKIIDHKTMKEGDIVIALPSSGVHSNGFSLVRKVFDIENADIRTPLAELSGKSLGEALLAPTKIYVKPMLALFEKVQVKAVSHITGGGFYENIPRSIPDGLCAKIKKDSVRVLPIFDLIAKTGEIPERDMFNTFNMGVGMSVVVSAEDAEKALAILKESGEDAYIMGEIVSASSGSEKVELW